MAQAIKRSGSIPDPSQVGDALVRRTLVPLKQAVEQVVGHNPRSTLPTLTSTSTLADIIAWAQAVTDRLEW